MIALAIAAPGASSRALADASADFGVALKLYQSKRFDVAADSFGEFIKRYPNDPQRSVAELYLGQSQMQTRKFKEARETFSTFLAENAEHPDRALGMYRLGEAGFFLNEFKEAETAFDDFLAKFPDNDLAQWAWQYLGESRLQQGNAAGALEAFQKVVDQFPKSPLVRESKFGIARAREALKDFDAALGIYRTLSDDATNPRAADALFHIGTIQYDAGDYAAAAETFASLRKRFPGNAQVARADLNEGYSLYYLGNFDGAAEAFERATRAADEEPLALLWIGLSRKAQERFDDAVAVLRPASARFGNTPLGDKLLFHWADSAFRGGHAAAAVTLFLQLADDSPTSELADRAVHLAVEASLRAGDLSGAERLHGRFTRDFPKSRLGMLEELLYGRVLLAKADALGVKPLTPEAEKLVRRAAEQFGQVLNDTQIEGTRDWARLLLGRAQQTLGDHQAALATLQPLVDQLLKTSARSEITDGLLLAGTSAIQISDWPTAEKVLTRFIELAPDSPDAPAAISRLAVAMVQQQKEAELDAMWEKFAGLKISPNALADAMHAAAELSFEQERWPQAEALFRTLEGVQGAGNYRAIALSGIGHSAYQRKNYPEAIDAFEKIQKEAPDEDPRLTADAVFMEGLSLELSGKAVEAAKAYRAGALRLAGNGEKATTTPADPEVAWSVYRSLLGAARAFAKTGEIETADASYEDAWTILQQLADSRRKESDKLLNEWALVNYHAGRFPRSDELFQRLADSFPQSEFHDDAEHHLAESLIQASKFEQAKSAFEVLLQNPASDDFVREASLVNLMELSARNENWTDSLKYSEQLLTQFPDSARSNPAKYRKGEAALRLNDFETAAKALSEVREKLVAQPEASFEWAEGTWLLLAEAELQKKDYPGVDALVTEFKTRFPDSPLEYQLDYIQGRRYSRAAEFEKAREAFQRVVDSPAGARTQTAAQSQFEIAETYLKQKEHAAAVREYYKVALGYDVPEVQSAAYFQAGQCEEVLKKLDGAVKTYAELVEKFPESAFAAKASERLQALKPLVDPNAAS